MKISNELFKKKEYALEHLFQKCKKLDKIKTLGNTSAAEIDKSVEDGVLYGKTCSDWESMLQPELTELDDILKEILATSPVKDTGNLAKIDSSKLWVWGGPTPQWGGCMADDTLVQGADYFNAKNGVYVYGPINEKMIAIHSGLDKLLCQINSNCRTKEVVGNTTDEEYAETVSKLSLKYKNIKGAVCDDVTVDYRKIVLPERFEARSRALKKYNDALKMYGVVYAHEVPAKDFSHIVPFIDVVNLWFWFRDDLLCIDETVDMCREKFCGKPILLGLFLHEYGSADAGNLPEMLIYQLDKAREYLSKGYLDGIVILGDREIRKWPHQSEVVKSYLQNQK